MRESQELEQALDAVRVRVEVQREAVQVARLRSREAVARAGTVRDRVRRTLPGGAADWCDQDRVGRQLQLARQELIEAFARARAVQYAPGSADMARLRRAEQEVQRLQAEHYRAPVGTAEQPGRDG